MYHLQFDIFGIFHQFWFDPTASGFQKLAKLTIFTSRCNGASLLAMLNETFSLIFKHCEHDAFSTFFLRQSGNSILTILTIHKNNTVAHMPKMETRFKND